MNLRTDKKIITKKGGWDFSGNVPKNFVDHANKSIPFYKDCHDLILDYSDFFCKKDSLCYEIGSATGELTKKVAKRFKDKNVHVTGIDNEKKMIDFANKNSSKKINNVDFQHKDILKFKFKISNLVISYYTIHFIDPKYRQDLFDKIYNSLNWGGGFILFEKVRAPDARFQDINTNLYQNFKLQKGFNHAEIYNKTESLKTVLEPFSSQANIDYMKRAGFKDITTIFKYICFEGFLAIK